ncbi:MAG: cytochrome c3 family protein [Acidobacteria bacterium]|nr:cytochrome c3 family protein [Acidobacteriota bacterium]
MRPRHLTLLLSTMLVLSVAALARAWRVPFTNQGYQPAQPIAFSHRQHAGELQISCAYCHSGAETSRYAGIPAMNVCMNCHRFVKASFAATREETQRAGREKRDPRPIVSPELRKLYDALGLNEALRPTPHRQATPIAWVRVHRLPDFVYFDHRAHATAGVQCAACHGAVASMDRIQQVASLTMGWCVNCHREVNRMGIAGKPVSASIDCSACHY